MFPSYGQVVPQGNARSKVITIKSKFIPIFLLNGIAYITNIVRNEHLKLPLVGPCRFSQAKKLESTKKNRSKLRVFSIACSHAWHQQIIPNTHPSSPLWYHMCI
jgi:hypothetical protein